MIDSHKLLFEAYVKPMYVAVGVASVALASTVCSGYVGYSIGNKEEPIIQEEIDQCQKQYKECIEDIVGE